MASKVIVCTSINAPTEAIEKYDTMSDWFLIVVGDKKTIIDGVLYFIENPSELDSFGNKNRENILENFSLNAFAKKFESEII